MGQSIKLFFWLGVFFIFVCLVYTGAHILLGLEIEWTGSVSFFVACILFFMVSAYLSSINKRIATLPEDKEDADIDDAPPDIGVFAPWSWWPAVLSVFLGIAAIGFSELRGMWLVKFTAPFVLLSIVGFVYEHVRGRWIR